jgi:hypothetical protein
MMLLEVFESTRNIGATIGIGAISVRATGGIPMGGLIG